MNRGKLSKIADCELVRWDPATGKLSFEIPRSGDYDADNAAAVDAAKTCLTSIEKLLAERHSSSSLTNKQASLLARQKKQLQTFISQFERES
jgi:hypothetical protein